MTTTALTDGNLALVLPATRPVFEVIDGFGPSVPASHNSAPVVRPRCPRCVLVLAIIVLIGALAAGASALNGLSRQQAAFESAMASDARIVVDVESGDTLWSIASAHPADGVSVDETVSILRSWNGLTESLLQPGMSLEVPA